MHNLTDQPFGKLVARRYVPGGKWHCECACGKTKEIATKNLVGFRSQSCGCGIGEAAQKRCRTHGGSKTPEYRSWNTMRYRCRAEKNYADRGITVCRRWQKFVCFLADMGPRPPGTSLERRNNDKGYSPGNCVWATKKTQLRNTRRNLNYTYDNRTQCLAAWCEELGLTYDATYARLRRNGNDFAAAVLPGKRTNQHG